MTIHSNDHPVQTAGDRRRTRSPAAWIVGFTFLIALFGILAFYSGEDGKPKSGDNPPNVVSESRGSK